MMASTSSGGPPAGSRRGEYSVDGHGGGSSSSISPRGRLLHASGHQGTQSRLSPTRRKWAAPAQPTTEESSTAPTRRCFRLSAIACALGLVVLGLAGPAVLRREILRREMAKKEALRRGSVANFVSFDEDIDLPEGAIRSSFPVSRDRKPGWMEYHEKLTAQAEVEGAGARVLVLGDSITEEMLGTSLGEPREDRGDALSVWLEYYDYLGAINFGVSGDQTQHLLWRLQNGELPDELQPEVILVAIGTNNLGAGMSVGDAVEGIRAVIEYLREERPGSLVCVMALFPRADREDPGSPHPWPAVDEVNDSLRPMLNREFGGGNVVLIDCTARFLAQDETGNAVLNDEFILPDNLHLTRDGLAAWADCAEAAVHSGLGE